MEDVTLKIDSPRESVLLKVRKGLGLQAIAAKHHTPLEFDCRTADCGVCIVLVREGEENLSPKTPSESDFLKAMHAHENERLACQCRIFGPVHLEVEF